MANVIKLRKKMYVSKNHTSTDKRVARCGHISKIGRWFKCERCVKDLSEDDGDLVYHQLERDENEPDPAA